MAWTMLDIPLIGAAPPLPTDALSHHTPEGPMEQMSIAAAADELRCALRKCTTTTNRPAAAAAAAPPAAATAAPVSDRENTYDMM